MSGIAESVRKCKIDTLHAGEAMRLIGKLIIFSCLMTLVFPKLGAQEEKRREKTKDLIQVIPVTRTPEPEAGGLYISYPQDGEMNNSNPVWIQIRLQGYALGTDSNFVRAREVGNKRQGQSLHVVIDNEPFFPYAGLSIDPFDQEGDYYDQTYKFKVPKGLKEGEHILRIFAARSYGEGLKGPRYFKDAYFYVGKKTPAYSVNLDKPYLTYNEPSGMFRLKEGEPILLDFYVNNCELSEDGYKVRLTIDGGNKRFLTEWRPYYVYGLKSGTHKFKLELVNRKNKRVPGPFSSASHTIKVD